MLKRGGSLMHNIIHAHRIIFYLTNKNRYAGPNSLILTSTYYLIIRSPNSFTVPHHVQRIRSPSHIRVRFAAISILRFISDFYLPENEAAPSKTYLTATMVFATS